MTEIRYVQWIVWTAFFSVLVLLSGCSTKTPYPLDIAAESPLYGKMTKEQAVETIRNKARISGEEADYRSFILDEEGFSSKKTTKTDKKTSWRTRNVPWNSIKRMTPKLVEHEVFGQSFIVNLEFTVLTASRMRVRDDFEIKAKTYKDLVDLVAAIKFLTGL